MISYFHGIILLFVYSPKRVEIQYITLNYVIRCLTPGNHIITDVIISTNHEM